MLSKHRNRHSANKFTGGTSTMTRTLVNTEPAVFDSPLPTVGPRVTEKVLKRTFSDGSVDYKCNLCEYTNSQIRSVVAHRVSHIRKGQAPGRRTSRQIRVSPAFIQGVNTLIAAEVARVESNGRDSEAVNRAERRAAEWKQRALAAEKQLEQLRRLLGNLGNS